MYVLCYDDASEEAASRGFARYDWATVTRLPDDPGLQRYMEGAAYLKTLHDNRAEWQDADLVGVLSYKAPSKIDVDVLRKVCEDTRGADVVALLPSIENMLAQAARGHPRFMEVWVPLLLSLGYEASDAVSNEIPAFYCNYWLATPTWMTKFLAFYGTVRHALDTLPGIQDALWSDAGYANTPERCMHVYGQPYIPHHPFVCERLACFYFWKEKATVALVPLGKKQFWQEFYEKEIENVCNKARLLNTHMPPR